MVISRPDLLAWGLAYLVAPSYAAAAEALAQLAPEVPLGVRLSPWCPPGRCFLVDKRAFQKPHGDHAAW